MSNKTGSAFDLDILRRVFRYAKPYQGYFYLTLFLTIFLAIITPLRPWLIQYTFDNYILIPDKHGLLMMTLLLIGLVLVEAVGNFFYIFLANFLGQNVIKDLRIEVFKHINDFKLKYFDNTPIGTLVTRVVSDIETIAEIFSQGLLVIIGDLLKLVVAISFMFYVDWRLTLISLSTIPILLVATYIFKNGIKSSFQQVRNEVSRLNAFLQEHITGMNIVQIFNREEEEMKRFKVINAAHRQAHIRSVWYYSIFLPVVEILSAASIGLLVWWGAKEALKGSDITLGTLMAFILYIYMLFRPIRELADKFNTLQMGVVSSERVFKILDTQSTIENKGSRKFENIKGEIDFKNVWFAYNNEDWVLKDINFKVKAGETLALVGATGAGKSSVINLLSRFYEYNKGEILADGYNIREYELKDLRRNIGVILQDVFLFSDTVMSNITLKNPDISREQVIAASKAVGAHRFIEKLPGGYDYDVKERGAMLSVGQRQLIAFVRAYVYDPRILVLDEATSSIDTESELIIQEALEKLTQGRTSIVIAHRLSTVQNASKIMVLEKGEVIEEGSHSELIEKNGHYKNLFELQFKENSVLP